MLKGFLQSMMALWDLFAPTANWESILLVLALYSINMVRGVQNLGIFKIDVASAFLHGELLDDKRYIMYAPNEAGVETAYHYHDPFRIHHGMRYHAGIRKCTQQP